MAEEQDQSEKTEEPSQYKIEKSREKGEVASSKELSSVLILAAVFSTIFLSSVYMFEVINEFLDWLYKMNLTEIFAEKTLHEVVKNVVFTILKMLAPVFIVSFCIGVLSQVVQVGIIYAPEAVSFKLERINPISGFKRLFSKKSIFVAFKGVVKFAIIIGITYWIVRDNSMSFLGFLDSELSTVVAFGKNIIFKVVFAVSIAFLVLAAIDFAWERYTYMQKMKMSKREQKEEHKEREGNPEIKQRIKSIQRELSRKRMMNEVPHADVIVTNPTHISVALKYNPSQMLAPTVVAMGADNVALKIRELAKENDVPIVENVPLARALYSTVKVGEGVPRTLYKAVAEILAFVYRLKRKKKALSKRGVVHG